MGWPNSFSITLAFCPPLLDIFSSALSLTVLSSSAFYSFSWNIYYQQILSFFSYSSFSSVSTVFWGFFFFPPPGLCSAALLSSNVLYLCILHLFMWSAKSTPPISPSFCLSFYSIPSLSLQLWQRMISPPILWPGCPGQELQCGASRGGGWGLGGDLREMDLIWITRAETPAVRVGSVCVCVCMCTRAGEMVMGGGKNAGLEQCELFWIRTSALQF